jgi:hypothetical protein
MSTIAEMTERPQAQLQAKIDESLHDQLKLLAVRKKCHPRDLVVLALKDYLPKVEKALDREKRA